MVQIGGIGAGGMGGRHARNLAHKISGAKVVAVMDVDTARASVIAAECDGAKVYSDVESIVADPDVQALVIASPDPFHAGAARACLKAGKPALCEKPLATNLADAKQVLDAELTVGRRLVQLVFMREYDSAHQVVKSCAERGDFGATAGLSRGTQQRQPGPAPHYGRCHHQLGGARYSLGPLAVKPGGAAGLRAAGAIRSRQP